MTIAAKIGQAVRAQESSQSAREFVGMRRCLMLARGSTTAAAKMTKDTLAGPRVEYLLHNAPAEMSSIALRNKAAVDPGSQLSGNWGSPLAVFESLANGFLSSVTPISVF